MLSLASLLTPWIGSEYSPAYGKATQMKTKPQVWIEA
jgi:hypothetical protein